GKWAGLREGQFLHGLLNCAGFSLSRSHSMSRVTLSRYLIEQTRSNNTPADLRFLIEVVARACKAISHQVSKGALGGVLGSAESDHAQWEMQRKLHVLSTKIALNAK